MKITKGLPRKNNELFYYAFKGQVQWATGKVNYNEKKKRYEWIHRGPRGGKYLIVWKD
jgi:hypothetical protein